MASEDDSNFFSRWSRRKVQVRTGEPLPAEPPVAPAAPVVVVVAAPVTVPKAEPLPEQPAAEAPPVLTLEDVARLTPESDYSAFVARGVPADVRNAAVKKLFTDPHYNVMDGLDIYIDDYSKPSPLSVADMAKMVGAQFLKLVDDPEDKPKVAALPDTAAAAEAEVTTTAPDADVEPGEAIAADASDLDSVSDSDSDSDTHKPHDDHADLQLQPDHALEPKGSGRGAG
ncbi:DUF3306 domain-containing protein [Hydrogenophaga sp. IBVHS1]|uniref:DUF3306 domain-containing protein n=1 Tax=unclassified Hydrogenophaga TaxID=2610897 RepID=UPI000A2E2740|nr:DUF3306 domain-containing protein [Hydrogenophaga sp. IBVHS1]OSZ76579.1 hypothetical protein CAP37_02875 [Hydrogenophaga sp. IBVHS1]